MPRIRIVSQTGEQTNSILDALRFFRIPDDVNCVIHYVNDHDKSIIQPENQTRLIIQPAESLEEIASLPFAASDFLVFADIATYDDYCVHKMNASSTLCVHNDAALLLTDIPRDSSAPKLKLCCLANEYYDTFGTDAVYRDFNEYLASKSPDEVLATNNPNLIQALTSVDSINWDIHHCMQNAINLMLIPGKPNAHLLRYRLSQALILVYEPKPHSLATIRKVREQCIHSYSFFADKYDEYMSHVAYDKWVSKIRLWFKQYSSRELSRLIELACGTANISTRFVFDGLHVDACDLSAEMLAVADTKPFKPNLYQASLTDPIPGRNYDLALCMFDSVNYLTKSKQVSTMLQEVYTALAEGGLFIFDISTLFNSEENFADTCSLTHSNESYMVHQAWFEPVRNKQSSALTSFSKGFIGYSYQYELHEQRVYMCADLINLIHKSEFKLKAIHSSESKVNLYPKHIGGIDDRFARLFFVLKKEVH